MFKRLRVNCTSEQEFDYLTKVRNEIREGNKIREGEISNVLVIGDLHEPFCLDGYLEFCIEQFYKYNCNKVVFTGDIIDNHYASYHENDPDGLGGGDELSIAINKLKKWHESFPNALVCVGNHDRIIARKAFSGGIPKRWLRPLAEALEVPTWTFDERFVIDEIQYIHGESGRATKKAKDDMMSTVQGHRHTELFCEWVMGYKRRVFGLSVGCGVDVKTYAMAYGRHFKKPAIGCGVVLECGNLPISIPMNLK